MFATEYYKWKNSQNTSSDSNSDYNLHLDNELMDIRKEKQKLYDARTALNKILRERGRCEEDLEILERLIKNNGKTTLTPNYDKSLIKSSDNDMIICLSDFHLGQTVDNPFGCYNSSIAKDRLEQYLSQIDKLRIINGCENAYVILLGDLISGEIHITTQLENRECLSEQVQTAAELISAFVYELSNKFNNVYINGVAGNHSRTSFKDQVMRNNRLDNLIPWYMKAKLSHLTNVKFIDKDNYDATIANFTVRGFDCVAVHGDYDSFSETGLSKLVMMLGYKFDFLFQGHLHHNSYDNISDIHMIRSGSFCGTGDDYTISKRISGSPSQVVCVIGDEGLRGYYPINFR